MIEYIAIEAGGIKGCSYAGIWKALHHQNKLDELMKNIKGIAGTSVGAIFALCLCLECTAEEIIEYCIPIASDFDKLAPSLDITMFFTNFRLDDGTSFRHAIGTILTKKGLSSDITLQTMQNFIKYEFICATTNIRISEYVYLSAKDYPNLKVVDAIFMSACVPFLFKPMELNGELVADGILAGQSLPMCFPPEKTLVLKTSCNPPSRITSLFDYMACIINCGENTCNASYIKSCNEILDVWIPKYLSDKGPLDRNTNTFIVHKYIQVGYIKGLQFIQPKFIATMDIVLQIVILVHTEFYACSSIDGDENSYLNF